MKRHSPQSRTAGFTIVELMIATLVFSVILLVVTTGVIHFTSSYYKGVNASATQNTTRSVIDTISQELQFNPGDLVLPIPGNQTGYFCIGEQEFVYKLGVLQPSATHSLYAFTNNGSCWNTVGAAPAGYANGKELLSSHTRLVDFSLTPIGDTGSLYAISLKIAYANDNSDGSNDLLCAPNQVTGSCGGGAKLLAVQLTQPAVLADVRCKSQIGSQYCSVVQLSTSSERRVQ